jgi:hypothetical protein
MREAVHQSTGKRMTLRSYRRRKRARKNSNNGAFILVERRCGLKLVAGAGAVRTNGLVWHVAFAPTHPVVN